MKKSKVLEGMAQAYNPARENARKTRAWLLHALANIEERDIAQAEFTESGKETIIRILWK